jgi:succinate dehydrogenase / fumarate reductase cytochrome b subunit
MVATHTQDAKSHGADIMVTPCPLCHLNLDGMQSQAASQQDISINLPILHLPQLLGLAMGMEPKTLGIQRHLISSESALSAIRSGL